MKGKEDNNKIIDIPVLPLRDVVVYPYMVIPLFVGRKRSIQALENGMTDSKRVLLLAQKNSQQDEPSPEDLYTLGTIATVLQLLRLPDGTVKVLVEGMQRARVLEYVAVPQNDYIRARVEFVEQIAHMPGDAESLRRTIISQFEQYVKINKKIPAEILNALHSLEDPERLGDSIAAHLPLKIEQKQELLEILDLNHRLERLLALIEGEIDLVQVEKRIRGRVKKQMEKSQREYYLKEQMQAIQKELGDLEEGGNETDELKTKIEKAGLPEEAKTKALAELNKLKMMSPMSAEATVLRNYLDWTVNIPWKEKSKINNDLIKAEEILNTDHYGLDKVKERILEYLAVQQRVKKVRGQVLCLVGPPGVGKTSLGQSIAKATGRKYVRVALGGVRDEAEIRGHRRTYIGSMPGKIIQKLSKIGVRNPLFLLDEIDKMAMDFRGDPASALLEVLDPEQNSTFSDHYLEVDYDLSEILFVTTANSLNIPGPLLDRMEIIRIPGYTEDEKLRIAMQHLLPKQIAENGLKPDEIHIEENAVQDIIRYYTREAGVRSLEREISKICRKVVREMLTQNKPLEKKSKKLKELSKSKNKTQSTPDVKKINSDNLENYLGVKRFRYGLAEEHDQIGQVTGLAWTEVGGELLTIEVASVAGKGKITLTGQLGNVMQESIQAALTVVRSRAPMLGILPDFYEKFDIHVHVPEGATPKDGPSAGIGMCTALVSSLTRIPVRADVAMTGEITLRGEVLPIGGLKEKLLAALRGGITDVVIPKENVRDLKEMPKNITDNLRIHPVRWIDEVLNLALIRSPEPLTAEALAPVVVSVAPKVKSRVSKKEKAEKRKH